MRDSISARTAEFLAFEHAFTQHAVVASVSIGVLCGLVGTFLVLRGLALLGDAAGHATLPGVCLGFIAAGGEKAMAWLMAGALMTGLAAAATVSWLQSRRRTRPDASIAVVLSVFFGAGIVLLSYVQRSPTGGQSGLNGFLFGNAAAVTGQQVVLLLGLVVAGGILTRLAYRPLLLATFDPIFAHATGFSLRRIDALLLTALGLVVVVSVQAVGAVLVSAMLIIPPSAALLTFRTLPRVLVASAVIGAISGFAGVWLSFVFEGVGTGPAMTLVAALIFVITLLVSKRGVRGALLRRRIVAGGHA